VTRCSHAEPGRNPRCPAGRDDGHEPARIDPRFATAWGHLARKPQQAARPNFAGLVADAIRELTLEDDDHFIFLVVRVQWRPAVVHNAFEDREPSVRLLTGHA